MNLFPAPYRLMIGLTFLRFLNAQTMSAAALTYEFGNVTSTGPTAKEITSAVQGYYPADLFSLEMRQGGWVTLHILGLIYMFFALAIVCDEFFIPSLTVIIERFQISEDVAGASFMAAGGSAPELFTSLMGLFVARTHIGIGTIVGSAVFNILFVIGMCAIVSKSTLSLTWWPLFRDVSFYSVGLAVLIYFFFDQEIQWWEALILFCLYLLYVLFMKCNQSIEKFVKGFLPKASATRSSSNKNELDKKSSLNLPSSYQEEDSKWTPLSSIVEQNSAPNLKPGAPVLPVVQPTNSKSAENVRELGQKSVLTKSERRCTSCVFHGGRNRYRHGIFQLMIQTIDPTIEPPQMYDRALELHTIATQTLASGSNSSTVLPTNGSTNISVLHQGAVFVNGALADETVSKEVNRSEIPMLDAVAVVPSSSSSVVELLANQSSGSVKDRPTTERPQFKRAPNSMPNIEIPVISRKAKLSVDETAAKLSIDEETAQRARISHNHQARRMSRVVVTFQSLQVAAESFAPDDDPLSEEPLSIRFPDTWRRRISYLIFLPIVLPLWITLPDVRKQEKRRFYAMTFLGSILWIGCFTYLTVWWAHQTIETFGMKPEVMGTTVLAAGTSIPDLITRFASGSSLVPCFAYDMGVIVARKGFGDMAVSSSIGSNVFDITVGLPIPWMLYCLSYQVPMVDVDSDGLVCSITMLACMLLTIVVTIAAFKWRMSKAMGVASLLLYVAFLAISVMLQEDDPRSMTETVEDGLVFLRFGN